MPEDTSKELKHVAGANVEKKKKKKGEKKNRRYVEFEFSKYHINEHNKVH